MTTKSGIFTSGIATDENITFGVHDILLVKGDHFFFQIREQVMRRFRILAHQKRHDDVVIEDSIPNIA